jgi:hypothetical protein
MYFEKMSVMARTKCFKRAVEIALTTRPTGQKAQELLQLQHALPSGTRGLMLHNHSLSLAPPISEPSALLLLLLP